MSSKVERQRPKAKILLVDDRPENLIALEAVLSCPEYLLVKANSGEEALRQVLQEDFAAILLDVQMPGLDGFETAMLIKKRERTQEVPILFISAVHKDELFSKRGYDIGGVDYIYKPFDPNSLRAKLAIYVSLYRKASLLNEQTQLLVANESRHQELRLAEIEVENKARFELLAEAIPQIVFACRPDGAFEYFNQRWYDYTGLNREDFEALSWIKINHSEDSPRVLDAWEKSLRSGEVFETEHRMKRSDGAYHWFLSRSTPVRDASGKIVRWYGTSTDIEDRKQIETRLEREVRTREEVMAIVSHDLKNPLGAIQLNLDLMDRFKPDLPLSGVRRNLDRIRDSTDRASQLIHELLDVAQIEAGRLRIERSTQDLRETINEAAEMLEPLAMQKQLSIKIDLPSGPCLFHYDRGRIHQLISNLLGNAIKFTPKGGQVRLRLAKSSSLEAVMTIEDTGPGIPQSELDRLFDRFWQGSSAGPRDGSGLGLFIAKAIAESHQGRIQVTSEPGSGTCFTVRLPCHETEARLRGSFTTKRV